MHTRKERKCGFVLLCSQGVDFWSISEISQGNVSLDSYSSAWKAERFFPAQTLWLLPEMSSLLVPSQDPKGSTEVLSFLCPGRVLCNAGMPSMGGEDCQVRTGILWSLSKPSFTSVASWHIWDRYASELTISQLLQAELLSSSLKGHSYISCPQWKIISDI